MCAALSGDSPSDGAGICLEECDALEPASSVPGEACVVNLVSDGARICLPLAEERELGAPCEFDNVCAPGLACLGPYGDGRECTTLCDLSRGDEDCEGPASGFRCVSVGMSWGFDVPTNLGMCVDCTRADAFFGSSACD